MPEQIDILVVDDESSVLEVVGLYLKREGYHVRSARDGQEALKSIREHRPSLIVLDLMLPKVDGTEIMRRIREDQENPIPVIMLTARGQEIDRIYGLELGADDYVTKPFSPRELTARVRAVMRRMGQSLPPAQVLRGGGITLDREGHFVKVDDKSTDLTPSEFDLLAILMSSPGRTFSRLELLDQIQGTAFAGYERTIDVHIRNLRSKIETNPSQPRLIETVYGVGYRFVAD